MRGEFDLIARYFAPLAAGAPGAAGLLNDAAVFEPNPDRELVVTADALVQGVHFLAEDSPNLIGRKLIRVNLSDLAAMGAQPRGYLLILALPKDLDETWIKAFAAGLAEDQREFGITLLGGDTVATPGPLTLSLTAIGEVPRGRALMRSTAGIGDDVYVSGTIGDGALGLKALTGQLPNLPAAAREALGDRYHLPQPRLAVGQALAQDGLATAALDVSDGLVADLGHIAEASGLGAEIEAQRVPLSLAARAALEADPGLRPVILTGGDDYELLFTAPEGKAADLTGLADRLDLPLTRIGKIVGERGVRVRDAGGQVISLTGGGWTHF